MHIKTLTIQGFKSYKDQVQIEPFSPHHNVVVGRNGSGKSNFFKAIQFVLSDAYTSMSPQERQKLLHEGTNTTATFSAYVEIVFDNSDNRFPTGREEVIIRRTIGQKKDEYSLDKKSASKADVMNLLESAGFSKSNPYYIVPQGRITALTNAKDHERLALLKEVAGTKVYEQRRTESLRIMADTDSKRTKINELIEYIESRLAELEEEKEELKEFQEKDKERRCLEYALYQRELEEVGETLEEIEEERRTEVHGSNTRREQFNTREKEIQDLEKTIKETKHALDASTDILTSSRSELNDLIGSRTELECTIADLESASERSGDRHATLEFELARLTAQIEDRKSRIAELTPEWEEARARESAAKRRLDEMTAQLDGLRAKQSRGNRFRNKTERDNFLRPEIAALTQYRKTLDGQAEHARNELIKARESVDGINDRITQIRGEIEEGKERGVAEAEEIRKLKEELSVLVERRKELWREDAKLDSTVSHSVEEMKTADRTLSGMMDKDTGSGLRAVDQIKERYGLDGVYGPLYRLFEVTDPKFNIAVELTAGNSLFHVVVDNDTTASKVLDIMLKEKTGRVTFMPLNRLKPKVPPTPNAQDAIPLIDKLQFAPEYLKAFQQVFGKTCVCRDLTIAAAYVKSHGINTITLDGDRVDRKGSLTGGYHDVRRSRIDAIKGVQTWQARAEADRRRSKEVKTEILQVDQRITDMSGRVQRANARRAHAQEEREALMAEGYATNRRREEALERVAALEREVEDLETEMSTVETKLEALQQELSSPFARGLSDEEVERIDELVEEVSNAQQSLAELIATKNRLGNRKSILKIELQENLLRKQDEVQAKIDSLGQLGDDDSAGPDLDSRRHELRILTRSIDTLSERIQEMEAEVEDHNSSLLSYRSSLEQLQNQQTEDGRNMSRQQKNTERYHAKRLMLMNRKEECSRNIRDLGVLPEEAFEKYINERADKLMKKLHNVNESLKKFAHVNKKAFEQYNNFTKQRDSLLSRREDLDKSAQSIEELVENLDQRKDEAIERTFKQVASNFEEVFEKLVPAGKGRLIIQRRIDQDEADGEDEAEETQQSTIDNYTGISIKVSFNSKVDEGLRIQQLSGGQKSLVALALVFAIQKCDPAPFYLFDEIDANLDAQYRTAVAAMIKNLSGTAQFITTTFRPEMLVSANQFYGVLFDNKKVSTIRQIGREEAMQFVEQEAQAR